MDKYMNEDKKVSIITVCYNSEKTIRRTIESVKNQTYENVEYIIVDGASSDNTVSIAKEYEMEFGERMKIISEPDHGIYDAMNKGIDQCTGELIGIINSDDYYENDAIEKIVQEWNQKGMQILYGMMRQIKDGKEHTVSILSHEFLNEQMIWHPSCFVTRDIYDTIGKFDTKYKSVADYDFMLRCYDSKKVMFTPVYSPIANFGEGGMSESINGYLEGLKYRKKRGTLSNMTYLLSCIYTPIKRFLVRHLWK